MMLIGWVGIAILPVAAENYTGDFLTNGVGGRALGLGGAYVSIADDVTATYWNPAGIAGISDNYQFCLMHAARRSGLGAFNYISGTTKVLSKLNLGLSWLRAGWMTFLSIHSSQRSILILRQMPDETWRKTVPRESDFVPAGYLNDSENAYILTLAMRGS